jgi:ATP-binding cassette subfamily B protein
MMNHNPSSARKQAPESGSSSNGSPVVDGQAPRKAPEKADLPSAQLNSNSSPTEQLSKPNGFMSGLRSVTTLANEFASDWKDNGLKFASASFAQKIDQKTEVIQTGLHFLKELIKVDPKIASARLVTMGLNNAVTYATFFSLGKVIQQLRPGNHAELFNWALTAAGLAVVERTFASKLEKQVESRHELVIDETITRRILKSVANIPVELGDDRAVANKVVEIRRSENDIKGLAKSGFALIQSLVTLGIGVGILASQLSASQGAWFSGPIFAAAVIVGPGLNLLRSAFGQAERKTEDARKLTESEKRNNYWRQRLIDPAGAAAFFLAGKSEEVIGMFMSNYSNIAESRYKTESANRKSQTVADLVSDVAVAGGSLALVYSVGLMQASVSGFVFLSSTLTKARLSFKDIGERTVEVSERLRFVETLYELEDLGRKGQENRQRVTLERAPDIKIENLEFTYGSATKPALQISSLNIAAGSRVVIVGDNGAGKSTFVKLLCGIKKPTQGSVLIDGHDTKHELPFISQIAQDEKDFAGFTVRQSMDFRIVGGQGRDFDEIVERTGVAQIMAKKKHGFDTRINASFSDGSGFSGGELQLISLAASLLSATPLKIRDEAFSALSPPKEVELTALLEEERGLVTTFDITHRLAGARGADTILVFENGGISAVGTHDELMAKEGWYRKNFLVQSENYSTDSNNGGDSKALQPLLEAALKLSSDDIAALTSLAASRAHELDGLTFGDSARAAKPDSTGASAQTT